MARLGIKPSVYGVRRGDEWEWCARNPTTMSPSDPFAPADGYWRSWFPTWSDAMRAVHPLTGERRLAWLRRWG